MFIMMFAAIGGGFATLSVMAPFGGMIAAACAPIGGSLCAVLAAAYITRHSGEAGGQADLDGQADAMVATLRELAARGAEPQAVTMGTAKEEDVKRARTG